MKRKRHTPEEIIKKLREASGLLAAGQDVQEVCRTLGVSAATYQRWKSHYGGVKKDALKRLRELEKENAPGKKVRRGGHVFCLVVHGNGCGGSCGVGLHPRSAPVELLAVALQRSGSDQLAHYLR